MSKAALLQAKAANLSESLASEVLDFLEFVVSKRELEARQQPEKIAQLKGAFKGRLSSSSEFAADKSNEIRLEE